MIMSVAAIQSVRLAPANFAEAAARDIVRRHSTQSAPADLRHAIILIPDLHAAADVACALRAAAAIPVLLLPRIVTLRQWSAEILLDKAVSPRAAREALVYGALAGYRSLGDADRWAVAGELLTLFDELTRHAVVLPETADDFARQLERAYRARKNRSFEFEAALVHELWHVMARDSHELDAEAAYQLRLAQVAARASSPLYALGLRRLAPTERRFLDTYAQRAPVVLFEPDAAADAAVSVATAAAWPPSAVELDLQARAGALKSAFPASPLEQRLSIFGATSLEQEARAVDVQVRDWLLSGKQRIAVVALDRVTARRARALLERAAVQVRDEAGWPMATTSAATAVSRWLDVVSGDAYHRDLLDLMKSPFSFHDWPREARQQTVWRLERYIRDANVTSGLAHFVALTEHHGDAEARQLLVRMQRGAGALGRARRPIARWLDALIEGLKEIGVHGGLLADRAGEQLSGLLEQLREDLAKNTLPVPFAEWRRWLARQLETASFIERVVDSPVVFTHLAATPLRAFDAVLVLGCDVRHLSGASEALLFFNQSVRAQLGLPTRQEDVRDTETLLSALIASSPVVLLTWQKMSGGETNLLAPPIERLAALHRCAYGHALDNTRLAALIAQTGVHCDDQREQTVLTLPPAPPAARALLPEAISASGYNTLVACPYQFHARYLLRLAELDDVQEMIEKSDYGLRVHNVLHRFHTAHARVSDMEETAAIAELERLSDDAFAEAIARNYLARGWLLRWKALIPDYIQWQRAREAEGWQWHAGEASRRIVIHTPAGRELTLLGRIDRVDRRGDDAIAVVDYKTRNEKKLKESLAAPGEDVQLPVYALLWGGPVAAALFLSIERDGVAAVAVESDIAQLAQAAGERLGVLYDAMSSGRAMPAQGAPAACEYCEMHGLCRRAHW